MPGICHKRLIGPFVVLVFLWPFHSKGVVHGQERALALREKMEKPFPENYEPQFAKLTQLAQVVESPENELQNLIRLQAETLEKIPLITTKAWFRLQKKTERKSTLILADCAFSRSPFCTKLAHWYPKIGLELENIKPDFSNFDCLIAHIYTPEMYVSSSGFWRKGLREVTIKNSVKRRDGLDLHKLLFQYEESPLEFREWLVANAKAKRYVYDVRRNKNLVELAFWPSTGSRSRSRRWVFDLDRGGLVVRYEDVLVTSITTLVDCDLHQIDGVWIPKAIAIERCDQKRKAIEFRQHFEFIDTLIVADGDIDRSIFSVFSLPVANENVPIKDQRTGRKQLYRFKDIKTKLDRE